MPIKAFCGCCGKSCDECIAAMPATLRLTDSRYGTVTLTHGTDPAFGLVMKADVLVTLPGQPSCFNSTIANVVCPFRYLLLCQARGIPAPPAKSMYLRVQWLCCPPPSTQSSVPSAGTLADLDRFLDPSKLGIGALDNGVAFDQIDCAHPAFSVPIVAPPFGNIHHPYANGATFTVQP